jgi:hypothetical protein
LIIFSLLSFTWTMRSFLEGTFDQRVVTENKKLYDLSMTLKCCRRNFQRDGFAGSILESLISFLTSNFKKT